MNFKDKKLYLVLLCGWITSMVVANSDSSCQKDCDTTCSLSKNFWYPRSFSSYQYHDLFQMKHIRATDRRDGKLNISFVTEYMQNFGGKCNSCKNLGALPFWSGTNQLTIGNNDGRAQLDAYQLGLGQIKTDEDGIGGVIQLNPYVQSIGTDMMMYWAQRYGERGLYFRIHAPIGGIRIAPNLQDVRPIVPENNLGYSQVPSGGGEAFNYEFAIYPTPSNRYKTVSEAFSGGSLCDDELAGFGGNSITFHYGRISPKNQAIIRLADIAMTLGYNVYEDKNGWAGLGFKVSFPTGNVPQAVYMLEPIYGRAGLWGVGGEITALYQFWENQAGDRRLTFSLQGEVEHLMHGRRPSMRSFDLKQNGKGSKYLLVQQYTSDYELNIFSPSNDLSETVSSGFITPAVNVTTIPVLSNFAVEGAVAVMFDLALGNWNVALGGEFWGRSRENLSVDMIIAIDKSYENLNDFAVIGRQLSTYTIPGNLPFTITTHLCEPLAQIGKSQDPAILSGTYPNNLSIPTTLPEGVKDATLSENRIPAKLHEALDIAGAEVSHVFTGKIFTHFGYNWKDCSYSPSVAVIGGIEFTGNTNNAIQLWSVGLQGSLNF
jgi:hypothetical protein